MPQPEVRWLSVKTCAVYMDAKPATIRAWINEGLPCIRIRRRHPAGRGRHLCSIRIDKIVLDKWLSKRSR